VEPLVYKHYDKAGLDDQFWGEVMTRNRDRVEALRLKLSEEARQTLPYRPDIAYGAHIRAKFDFFSAEQPNAPVLVFFHGGYWRRNDKREYGFIALGFVRKGISVAVMNFPLVPVATIDIVVQHARAGIAFIAQHASQLGINPGRIHVCGHSSGGHLAAMAMQTDWSDYGLDHDPLRGVTAVSGLYDLLPVTLSKVWEFVEIDAESAYRNSPIHFLSKLDTVSWKRKSIILCVGSEESHEFKEQQREFAHALHAKGLKCESMCSEGDTHAEVILRIAQQSRLHDTISAAIEGDTVEPQ
jgi:arylformamidase